MTSLERDEKLSRDLFLVPHSERLGLIAAYREEIEQAAAAEVRELKEEVESLRCDLSELDFRPDC